MPVTPLLRWRQRAAFRRALRAMLATAPHLIPDIGLTEAEARQEAAKPFWRP